MKAGQDNQLGQKSYEEDGQNKQKHQSSQSLASGDTDGNSMRARHENTIFENAYYCLSSVVPAALCCGLAQALALGSGWPLSPCLLAQQCAHSCFWFACGVGFSFPLGSACGAALRPVVSGGWTTRVTTFQRAQKQAYCNVGPSR